MLLRRHEESCWILGTALGLKDNGKERAKESAKFLPKNIGMIVYSPTLRTVEMSIIDKLILQLDKNAVQESTNLRDVYLTPQFLGDLRSFEKPWQITRHEEGSTGKYSNETPDQFLNRTWAAFQEIIAYATSRAVEVVLLETHEETIWAATHFFNKVNFREALTAKIEYGSVHEFVVEFDESKA